MSETVERKRSGRRRAITLPEAVLFGVLRAALIATVAVLVSVAINLAAVPQAIRLPFGALYILLWVALYVIYFRHQMKMIAKADFPAVRAWETLIVGGVMFMTIFANAYHQIAELDSAAFSEKLDLFTSYYFTVTILGTVGFGDITPVTVLARSVSMVQMLVDLGIIAFTVRLITRQVKQNREPGPGAGDLP
ncbi:MAG: potassium channel family protein [Candidatus Nanopelagicales bacterium]